MVAMGVYLFISYSEEAKKYMYLETEILDTAYGVDGIVKEKREVFSRTAKRDISMGVLTCILSCVPLLISAFSTEKGGIIISMVGVLLALVAFGVNRLVRVGIIQSSYEKLLQEGDYTPGKKKTSSIMGEIAAIYWCIATAIYLAWSLFTMKWGITWVIWPVAGVLYGAIEAVAQLIVKEK